MRSDLTLALITTAVVGSIGAMGGASLHTILGRDGYPMGIFVGYVVVFFISLALMRTGDWREKHDGKRAADIFDLVSVFGPIIVMVLCSTFIPWIGFHCLPRGKAPLATGIALALLAVVTIALSRFIASREKASRNNVVSDSGMPVLVLVFVAVMIVGGGVLSAAGYGWGLIFTVAGLAVLLVRGAIRAAGKRKPPGRRLHGP